MPGASAGNEVKGRIGRSLRLLARAPRQRSSARARRSSPRTFLAVSSTPAPLRRARDTGAQKWLRDPASLKARVDRCRPAAMSCSVRATAAPGRAAAMVAVAATVHEIDHRDRCIRFGKRAVTAAKVRGPRA